MERSDYNTECQRNWYTEAAVTPHKSMKEIVILGKFKGSRYIWEEGPESGSAAVKWEEKFERYALHALTFQSVLGQNYW